MTLKEAHESSKEYRKVGSTGNYGRYNINYPLVYEDAIAEYELESEREKTVVITRKQLDNALIKACTDGFSFIGLDFMKLRKELGLGEGDV